MKRKSQFMRHIDEFTIHHFRGMREAKFETLGQINLLIGSNNSGKTSVLEALSVFCDPLNPRTWSSVASARETSPLGPRLSLSDRILWLFPQEENELSFSAYGGYQVKNI